MLFIQFVFCFFRIQGCLAPIKVIIPPGSILQPSQNAAVVGGNVLTSQRVVDIIFKAFEVCAASQVSKSGFLHKKLFNNKLFMDYLPVSFVNYAEVLK